MIMDLLQRRAGLIELFRVQLTVVGRHVRADYATLVKLCYLFG
jgi:hypothetical protein